ncbi:lysozyme inhibitor LprI family protein [Pseudogulbenkiania ferrooxidans]|uniref:lysozyme inhibitor LprI family protein n=1 Tax=Pseudogulbenkiania ferrooxidans TaxID=549169 RepID=UPI00135F1C2D|nr:lysozyme inhibitor LprI family protein [Pseudogulbenkiania ferrooxidans]
MKKIWVAVMLMVSVSCANALPSAEFRLCVQRAGSKDVQRSVCYQQEMAVQDARLNRAYQAVMKGSSSVDKVALRQHQRSWIRQRDNECKEELGGETVINSRCVMEKTDQRADELESKLSY